MEVDMHYVKPMLIAGIIVFQIWIFRDFLIQRISFIWWLHLLCFLCTYITLVFLVYSYEILITSRLTKLDLNGDGMFRGEEITTEYMEVLKIQVSDTARKMSIYTALIYSELITISLHIIDLVINKYRNTVINN